MLLNAGLFFFEQTLPGSEGFFRATSMGSSGAVVLDVGLGALLLFGNTWLLWLVAARLLLSPIVSVALRGAVSTTEVLLIQALVAAALLLMIYNQGKWPLLALGCSLFAGYLALGGLALVRAAG